MRKVDRTTVPEPANLNKPRPSDGKTELQLAIEHYEGLGMRSTFEFGRYKDATVKTALERLFHGKCAYCETFFRSTQPVDVEHYRPKGEVDRVESHRGYWWLAMDWQNLLPSCIDCNRRRLQKIPSPRADGRPGLLENGEFDRSKSLLTGKESAFPLIGGVVRAMMRGEDLEAERRLLLDPCRDDPDEHLVFHVDREHLVSLVYPKPLGAGQTALLPDAINDPERLAATAKEAGISPMGMVSIQVYGLNRLGLVQARTRLLHDMEFLLDLALSLGEVAFELDVRIGRQNAKLATVSAEMRAELRHDIDTDAKIAKKIGYFIDEIRSRLRDLVKPNAPYSRLAKAWIQAYLSA